MKYIIIEGELPVFNPVPIFFPEAGDHAHVANGRPVVSAGFVQIDFMNRKCHAYGQSISLKLQSRPEDSRILELGMFGRD